METRGGGVLLDVAAVTRDVDSRIPVQRRATSRCIPDADFIVDAADVLM
jgi:hypothetical protein